MKTLYVTDMDGTLLDDSSRVSVKSTQILNNLIRRGAMVTVATARTPATVQPLLRNIEQPVYTLASGATAPLPAIVMTGAALWDRADCRFLSYRTMDEADALVVRDTLASCGLDPFVYCLSGDNFLNVFHSEVLTRRERGFYEDRRHLKLKRFHLGQTPRKYDSVVLFFAIGEEEKIIAASEALKRVTPCTSAWYPDILIPDTGLIDSYAPGVSKAGAVRSLAAQVGADRIVVFGDNLNDLPMLGVATVAVAVENALPEVKAKADVIIGPNTTDAVAQFIAKDFLR